MYKIYKNKLSHILDIAERKYYENRFELHKTDLRRSWQLIKEVIGRQKVYKPISNIFKTDDDTMIKDPTLISNKFNEYFTNIGKSLANNIPSSNTNITFRTYLQDPVNSCFFLTPTTDE